MCEFSEWHECDAPGLAVAILRVEFHAQLLERALQTAVHGLQGDLQTLRDLRRGVVLEETEEDDGPKRLVQPQHMTDDLTLGRRAVREVFQ